MSVVIAALLINTTALLSHNGSAVDVNRTIVLGNMHATLTEAWTPSEAAAVAQSLPERHSISFGRSIGRLEYVAKSVGTDGTPWGANVSEMIAHCAKYPQTAPSLAPLFPKPGQLAYIESVNSLFWFDKVPPQNHPKHFAPNRNISAIAQYYVDYLESCIDPLFDGKIAEVMNEPDGELLLWKYHNRLPLVIEMHNAVADAVHARYGSRVRVAGPTACDLAFPLNNYSVWNDLFGPFIAQSGTKVDLFSIHLYDNFNGQTNEWHTRKIGSNIQAVLDLVEATSQSVLGYVKPMEVSEFGTSFFNWKNVKPSFPFTARHCWAVLMGVHGKIFELLERGERRVVKGNPFIIHAGAWWKDGIYPFSLFLKDNSTTAGWKFSPLHQFYTVWRHVAGKQVLADSSNPNVQLVAFLPSSQRVVYVANNLRDEPANVTLNVALLGATNCSEVRTYRARNFWNESLNQSVVADEEVAGKQWMLISENQIQITFWLHPNEATSVVVVFPTKTIPPATTIQRMTNFASETQILPRFEHHSDNATIAFTFPRLSGWGGSLRGMTLRLCGAVTSDVGPTPPNDATSDSPMVQPLQVSDGTKVTFSPADPMAGYATPDRGSRFRCWTFKASAWSSATTKMGGSSPHSAALSVLVSKAHWSNGASISSVALVGDYEVNA